VATSRILLISDATDDAVATALETPSHVVTRVADAKAALTAEGAYEVVVIDLSLDYLEVIDARRAFRESPGLAPVPVLVLSHGDDIDERIELLEAGVDDVMIRPIDPRELDARVEALVLRYQRSRGQARDEAGPPAIAPRAADERRLIAVFSPKGGVGTTTVAVNLAVAMAGRSPDRVVIIDLDLQFGQVSTHLNLVPRHSIADLARDDVGLRDPGVFQTYIDRHASSGLAVLSAPASPDGASVVTDSTVQRLLETASKAFQIVIVDAGSQLDGRTEAVLKRATDIIIVVTPEFPALKAVHAMRDRLEASVDHLAETSFILNQTFAREILRLRDIEEALGTKIALTIPYDAFAFLKSVNEGVPVMVGAARTPAAMELDRLATRISGIQATDDAPDRRPRGLGALFGRG
jgi:pilus assembly protein CpaE